MISLPRKASVWSHFIRLYTVCRPQILVCFMLISFWNFFLSVYTTLFIMFAKIIRLSFRKLINAHWLNSRDIKYVALNNFRNFFYNLSVYVFFFCCKLFVTAILLKHTCILSDQFGSSKSYTPHNFAKLLYVFQYIDLMLSYLSIYFCKSPLQTACH